MTVYAGGDWTGHVLLEGLDATLSGGALAVAALDGRSGYSVEWNGALLVDRPGPYSFWITSDGATSLEVNGQVVVDNERGDRRGAVGGAVELPQGAHVLRVRFVDTSGRGRFNVAFAEPGAAPASIPEALLRPDQAAAHVLAWRHLATLAGWGVVVAFAIGTAYLARRAIGPVAGSRVGHALARAALVFERPSAAVAIITAAGLAIRLLFLASTPAIVWADSHVFYTDVREVLRGAWTSHDSARTLLYPLYLAAVLGRTQSPALGTLAIAGQQLMGLLAAVLFYLVGRRAFTPLVAFGGALLFALEPLLLFYEISVLTEALFVFVLSLVLWAASRAIDRRTMSWGAALGLACALLVLTRPVAAWFAWCLAGALAAPLDGRRWGWKPAVAMLLCYAAPIAWWMSVNQAQYGFRGVALGRGMGLYTRVFSIDRLLPPDPSRFPEMRELFYYGAVNGWSANRVRDELNFGRKLSGAAADEAMYQFALETVRHHPLTFATNTARQWVIQVADPADGMDTCPSPGGPYLCKAPLEASLPAFPNAPPSRRSAARRFAATYATRGRINSVLVFACALLGAWSYFRSTRRNTLGILLGVSVAYFTLVPAISQWPHDRFRLPVDALLFMFAAWGIRALAASWPAGPARGSGLETVEPEPDVPLPAVVHDRAQPV